MSLNCNLKLPEKQNVLVSNNFVNNYCRLSRLILINPKGKDHCKMSLIGYRVSILSSRLNFMLHFNLIVIISHNFLFCMLSVEVFRCNGSGHSCRYRTTKLEIQ